MVNENNQDWDKHPKKANRKRENLRSLGNSNILGTRLADETGQEGGTNKEQETQPGSWVQGRVSEAKSRPTAPEAPVSPASGLR